MIVMMVGGALSEVALAGISTCEKASQKLFPSKDSQIICKSSYFDPSTLLGQMNLVDLMLYQNSDLKILFALETGYHFEDFSSEFEENGTFGKYVRQIKR